VRPTLCFPASGMPFSTSAISTARVLNSDPELTDLVGRSTCAYNNRDSIGSSLYAVITSTFFHVVAREGSLSAARLLHLELSMRTTQNNAIFDLLTPVEHLSALPTATSALSTIHSSWINHSALMLLNWHQETSNQQRNLPDGSINNH
jgi:hypothetical protein